ncbi:MAG: DUF502 domain-containing protein [Bacteroidota bacterium]
MAKQKIARRPLLAPTQKKKQFKNMKRPRSFREFLMTTFIGGFLVLLPITIFIFLVQFVFRIVARVIEPIAKFFSNVQMATFFADLLAFIIVVAFCFVVGLLVRTNFGNTIIKHFNTQYLSKLPFYNTIQEIVQQLFGKKENSFSQVVLVNVFDTLMTGFVTDEHPNGIYTVFVPTAPNPTNGFVFHVKKEKLIFTDVKPEDAMRTVIGVGTGSAVLFTEKEKMEEKMESSSESNITITSSPEGNEVKLEVEK